MESGQYQHLSLDSSLLHAVVAVVAAIADPPLGRGRQKALDIIMIVDEAKTFCCSLH